jgi:uncharacterized membrane protein YuzA (DUF378 family)
MQTFILYGIVAVFLSLSLLKDRERTRLALRKGLKVFEGILPQFLLVLVIVASVLAVFDPDTVSKVIGERFSILGVIAASIVGAVALMAIVPMKEIDRLYTAAETLD